MTLLVPVDVDVIETSVIVDVDIQETTVLVPAEVDTKIVVSNIPDYVGEYDITPSPETQVLEMADMKATRNVIVAPIPNNYGLITYNGSVLTVS